MVHGVGVPQALNADSSTMEGKSRIEWLTTDKQTKQDNQDSETCVRTPNTAQLVVQ